MVASRQDRPWSIVAVRDRDGSILINPPAALVLEAGREIVLAGTDESEEKFKAEFGD